MEFLLFRQFIVLLATVISAYTDWKDGNIYNYTTYPLILIGMLLMIIDFDLYVIILATIIFGLSYLLYYVGKLGGGDVKLFLGITFVLPMLGNYPFILSLLFVSAMISIVILSVYYLAKYFVLGINIKENETRIKQGLILVCMLIFYFYIIFTSKIITLTYLIFIGVPLFLAILFFCLEKGIRKNFFLKKINVEDIEEDDLIACDFVDNKTKNILKLNLKGIIGKQEKDTLIKSKIKTILVYRNLPKFAPFILIGELIVFIYPNILDYVFFVI